ncbi:MAG: hypothetical protein OHK0029_16160 [Armatimonadaceae bacterium]
MIRGFALTFGIIYLIAGILGFVPGVTHHVMTPADTNVVTDPGLVVEEGYGLLFGLFPINILHNLFHIAIGIWGIVAAGSVSAAVGYSRSIAVIYGLLAIMGLFPVTNVLFGIIPLYGNDIWLHALSAAVAAYFGFFAPATHRNDRVAGRPTTHTT